MQGFGGHGPSGIRKKNTDWINLKEIPCSVRDRKYVRAEQGTSKGLSCPSTLYWQAKCFISICKLRGEVFPQKTDDTRHM